MTIEEMHARIAQPKQRDPARFHAVPAHTKLPGLKGNHNLCDRDIRSGKPVVHGRDSTHRNLRETLGSPGFFLTRDRA